MNVFNTKGRVLTDARGDDAAERGPCDGREHSALHVVGLSTAAQNRLASKRTSPPRDK